ncbi:MAG: PAS domain-containing sensor histidine kinase [Cyclobacteriaceae bacterium]|nr:PAS domain-containing sensor histidine kinase [Cyclobacteriaceae bacterium]
MKVENLLDSSADGVFVFNNQLVTTVWNKKLANQFNCPSQLACKLPIYNAPLFINNKAFKKVAESVLKGKPHNSQHNIYVSDSGNNIFYYTLNIDPVLNDSDVVIGGMGTIKEVISIDKQSSVFSFNDFIHNNESLPKIIFSKEGKLLHFNEPCKELWGITPKSEKFIRKNYNLFKDEQLVDLNLMGQIKNTSTFQQPEIPIVEYETRKTSSIKSLKNQRKKISGFIKTNLDNKGEFNELEVTLVDLSGENNGGFDNPWFAQKFQKLTKNLPGVIYEYTCSPGEEGVFNYISQSCEHVFGYTDKQIKSNPMLMKQLIHPDDIVSYLQSNKKAEDRFANWEWEGRFVVKGKSKWIRGNSRPEKTSDGGVTRYGILTDITNERIAQRNQETVTKRLKLAIKGTNLGMWDWTATNNRFTVNDTFFAKTLGYTKPQFIKDLKNWIDYIHPDDMPLVYKKVIDHLKGLTEFLDLEMRAKRADGKWIWISLKAQVTDRSKEGKAIRLTGTIQDINSRKEDENTLAQSEARYRGLVEHSPAAIVVYREGKVVFANDQTYKLLGINLKKESLIGENLIKFVKPEYQKKVQERINKVFRSNKASQSIEETLIRKDGKKIIVEMVAVPFEDQGQRSIQIIASDITNKISTEKILKKSEKLLTQLFESSPIGIVLLDAKKHVIQINKGFQDIFGYTNKECFSKKLNELIIPEGYHGQAINLNSLIVGGNVVKEVESVRCDKDGNLIPVMIYGVPVSLNDKVIAIYGIYVDIRASKKVEEELKIRNEELDNFVYKVSHDLRSPLSSTLGLVHLANLEESDDNLRQYIELIGDRISQLDRFIGDVLSHSKNLKVELIYTKINFKEIIEEKFSELDYLHGANMMSKNVNTQGQEFYGDKWRISEVFRNLISNAIKYMNRKTDNAFVNVDINITPKKASIVFSDNGIGISSSTLPKIFDMFYRATDISEGSGIGLYIVKNAINKMGGKIKLESEQGKGTTFKITLPNHPPK